MILEDSSYTMGLQLHQSMFLHYKGYMPFDQHTFGKSLGRNYCMMLALLMAELILLDN